ncbi:MAG: hypothetical protein ACO4AM_07035 [Candidatus Nanopelagicaceae bacterium]
MKAGTISTDDLLVIEDACKRIKDEIFAYTFLIKIFGADNWTSEHDEMFKYFRGHISFTSPE